MLLELQSRRAAHLLPGHRRLRRRLPRSSGRRHGVWFSLSEARTSAPLLPGGFGSPSSAPGFVQAHHLAYAGCAMDVALPPQDRRFAASRERRVSFSRMARPDPVHVADSLKLALFPTLRSGGMEDELLLEILGLVDFSDRASVCPALGPPLSPPVDRAGGKSKTRWSVLAVCFVIARIFLNLQHS